MASRIYSLIDSIIADVDNLLKPQSNKNDYKGPEIRTSITHPLYINWLKSEYKFVKKVGNRKKLKLLKNQTKSFDGTKQININFRLGMTVCPGKYKKNSNFIWKRDICVDLDYIKSQKVDIIVSLLDKQEINRLKVESLFNEIEKRGIESIFYNIKDGKVPINEQLWKQYASYIGDKLINENQTVLVHCMGGLCRTGAFILTVLKYLKLIKDDTLAQGFVWIHQSRKGAGGNLWQTEFVQSIKF